MDLQRPAPLGLGAGFSSHVPIADEVAAIWVCSAAVRWLLHRSPFLKSTKRFRLNQITKEKMLKKLMCGNQQVRSLTFGITGHAGPATLLHHLPTAGKHRRSFRTGAMVIVFALTVALMPSAQAQTYTVLHNFTGGLDGGTSSAGLTMDKAGNLYGTTYTGGIANRGTVFKLIRKGGSFVFNTLHGFASGEGKWPLC